MGNNKMSKVRRIIEIYFNNACPGFVQKKFFSWFLGRKDDEAENGLREVWKELKILSDGTTEESFLKLKKKIERKSSGRWPLHAVRSLLRIAAASLVVIVSISFTYYYMKKSPLRPPRMELAECIAPKGETRRVTLPDSSQIELNAGSSLIYQKDFTSGETREVYLNGEAYFRVVHDEKKPFIVRTSDFDVRVLGTVFDVSSYTDDDISSVALESGKVNVRMKNGKERSFILLPNEEVYYDRASGRSEKRKADIAEITGWKDGYLLINALSISEMAGILEKKFGVRIYLNTNKYDDEKITAKFINGENIQNVFSVLRQLIPGMEYKIEGHEVYIN